MKTYFYYLRDEKRAPVVTICLKVTDTEIARGVAMVNTVMDFPNKKVGRQIAEGRAIKAMVRKSNALPLRGGAGWKSEYMPDESHLLPLEAKLVETARQEAN